MAQAPQKSGITGTQALTILLVVLIIAAIGVAALLLTGGDAEKQKPVTAAAYANEAAAILGSYSSEFSNLGALLSAPRMADEGWRNQVSSGAQRAKDLSKRARSLSPPGCLIPSHTLLVATGASVDDAMNIALDAIRTRSDGRFAAVLPRLSEATQGFRQLTQITNASTCTPDGSIPEPPTPTQPARVIVEGNPGVQFSGLIGEFTGSERTVQGTTPVSYVMNPSKTYSAVIQKRAPDAALELVVTIVCPNGTRKSSSTNLNFGVARVSAEC